MNQRSNPYGDADGSKPSGNSPRGRHRDRDEQGSSSKPDTTPKPKPDCGSGSAKTEWKARSVTDALLAFFDPCSECFPDGKIRCETVVRSRNQHASYVHLQDGATNTPPTQSESPTASTDLTDDELARVGGTHTGGSR